MSARQGEGPVTRTHGLLPQTCSTVHSRDFCRRKVYGSNFRITVDINVCLSQHDLELARKCCKQTFHCGRAVNFPFQASWRECSFYFAAGLHQKYAFKT